MAYFERLDETRFRATEQTSGAWREDEQHILGLFTLTNLKPLEALR